MDDTVILVDARGLKCPLPVLQARAQLRELAAGARILLLADDPLASVDVQAFCLRAGHVCVSEEAAGDHLRFVIERGG